MNTHRLIVLPGDTQSHANYECYYFVHDYWSNGNKYVQTVHSLCAYTSRKLALKLTSCGP